MHVLSEHNYCFPVEKKNRGNVNKGERVKAEAHLAKAKESERERPEEERLKGGQQNNLTQGTISGVTKQTKGHEKKKMSKLRKLP